MAKMMRVAPDCDALALSFNVPALEYLAKDRVYRPRATSLQVDLHTILDCLMNGRPAPGLVRR
jgi:hypothetical protein